MGEYERLRETYQIYGQIGKGGVGTVFKAYHKRLRKEVVLKRIRNHYIENDQSLRREVDILKNLHHEYLPQVYDYLNIETGVYTVMDYIPGKSIKEILDVGECFSEKDIVKYGKQLSKALSYLHRQNPAVIHGDIKPANIMLRPNGDICLIDFNISGIAREYDMAYVAGYSNGYAAPEQIRAYQLLEENPNCIPGIPVSTKSDVYSLGATLFHMLTGQRLDCVQSDVVLKNAPDGFCEIINRSLEMNPEQRFANASEMLDAFENIYKYDKRMKSIHRGHKIGQVVFIIMLTAGICLTMLGFKIKRTDDAEQYISLINKMEKCIEDNDKVGFEEAYEEAVSIRINDYQADLKQAEYDHKCLKYADAAEKLENLLNREIDIESKKRGYIYYLLGDCYYEIGEKSQKSEEYYQKAHKVLQKAIQSDSSEGKYYSLDARSCIKMKDNKEANRILEEAEKKNIQYAYLDFIRGEIAASTQKYEQAEIYYDKASEQQSEDTELVFCCYCEKAELYKNKMEAYGFSQNDFSKEIEILKEAKEKCPDFYQFILNKMAVAYINYYKELYLEYENITNNDQYLDECIQYLKEYTEISEVSFNPYYSTMVDIHEKRHEFADAEKIMKDYYAEKKDLDQNPNNAFDYYAAYTVLEMYKINNGENQNYDDFKRYYDEVMKQYDPNKNVESMQMKNKLEEYYKQLQAAGKL